MHYFSIQMLNKTSTPSDKKYEQTFRRTTIFDIKRKSKRHIPAVLRVKVRIQMQRNKLLPNDK